MGSSIHSAVLALVCFGVWAFLPKLATQTMQTKYILLFDTLGMALAVILILLVRGTKGDIHPEGVFYSVLAGFVGGIGSAYYYFALKDGKAGVLATFMSLYPIVTVLLAFLVLGEVITLRHGLGIGFGLIAISLLAV